MLGVLGVLGSFLGRMGDVFWFCVETGLMDFLTGVFGGSFASWEPPDLGGSGLASLGPPEVRGGEFLVLENSMAWAIFCLANMAFSSSTLELSLLLEDIFRTGFLLAHQPMSSPGG